VGGGVTTTNDEEYNSDDNGDHDDGSDDGNDDHDSNDNDADGNSGSEHDVLSTATNIEEPNKMDDEAHSRECNFSVAIIDEVDSEENGNG